MDKLDWYRRKIDVIDKSIIRFLLARFKLVQQIAVYKKENKIRLVDKKREHQVINKIEKYKKHQKFFKKIFGEIIDYSKKIQK